jgi:hypothetical protein
VNRIQKYFTISTSLACLSNEKLRQILDEAKPMHAGIGGTSSFCDCGFFNQDLCLKR